MCKSCTVPMELPTLLYEESQKCCTKCQVSPPHTHTPPRRRHQALRCDVRVRGVGGVRCVCCVWVSISGI